MKEQIMKALQYNQALDIMYLSKTHEISKRRIKLIKIAGNTVQAYCFTRHAKRTFIIDNILAAYPAIRKVGVFNA